MDFVELAADGAEEVAAGSGVAFNLDGDAFVFFIGTDEGGVVAFLQHYAAAPVGALADFAVHTDDEAGDDAGGQNVVVILEGEGALPFSGVGFFFGEESGDEELGVGMTIEIKAQVKLAHDADEEAVLVAGIAIGIKNIG